MSNRNYSDVVPGILIAAFGAAVAGYAVQTYTIGTLQRMGPGMFPMGLGVLLSVLGVALAIVGWFRSTEPQVDLSTIQWRPAVLILISVTAFALLIRSAGLFPAVIAVVGISAFSDKISRPGTVVVLCGVLCVLAWLIFSVGLGLNLKLLDWPF